VKSPVEFALGLAQRFELGTGTNIPLVLAGSLNAMGQTPLAPPDVAGYPVDLEWAGTSALLARYNAANRILYLVGSEAIVAVMTQGLSSAGADELAEALVDRMGPLEPGDGTWQALLDYARANYQPSAAQIAIKTRGLLHLIASSPEYQLN